MQQATPYVEFELTGVASALKKYNLRVPLNQREYSWEEEHVTRFLSDIQNALIQGLPIYFLGTIVLVQDETPKVVDGQQRLATTIILLAAIRDYFKEAGEKNNWESIDYDFIQKYDRDIGDQITKLSLNTVDNSFFREHILALRENGAARGGVATKASHRLIAQAATYADTSINTITSLYQAQNEKSQQLLALVKFLEQKAAIVIFGVPDGINAYKMFETLNDRGLKTSQADLLKNYLFGQSGNRLAEVQEKWSAMITALESLNVSDDSVILTYLRQLSGILHGVTRSPDVYSTLQKNVSGQFGSVAFAEKLSQYAGDYVAMLTPSDTKWSESNQSVRDNIEILNLLEVERIRPLILAVVRHFTPEEIEKAFSCFVAWSVRAIIVGISGGQQENVYTDAGKKVVEGQITKTRDLITEVSNLIPKDDAFEAAFAITKVSKHDLGRYYLRQLEKSHSPSNLEVTPFQDPNLVNLEHILPKNPDATVWTNITAPETIKEYSKRLGNMALLNTGKNSKLGNESYPTKKVVYSQSQIQLTLEVASKWGTGDEWGQKEIIARQKYLADLAKNTWTLKGVKP